MIVPFVLLSDQSNIKFFINGRNRDIKSVNFFFISITICYFICCRLKNLSSVFLGIFCLSNKKIYDFLWIQAHMDRHLTIFDCQRSFTVICFIYMKHSTVCIKLCTVSTVFKHRILCIVLFVRCISFCIILFIIWWFWICHCCRNCLCSCLCHNRAETAKYHSSA